MPTSYGISRSPTGIEGFDDLTLGGLPTGRPTLVCGSAGCGKTLFASTFLVHGARECNEPGVFVTRSEEHTSELQSLMRISYAVFCLKKKKNYYQCQLHTA